MKRTCLRKIGKVAVMVGRASKDPKCQSWGRKVRRAMALVLTHPRLTKVL